MKMVLSCALVVLALLFPPAAAPAAESWTDPVGFVSPEIPPNGYSYIGICLVTSWNVRAPADSLSGAIVTVNGVDFNAALELDRVYFMEITSGPYEGYQADVASWSGNTVTLVQDIEAAGIEPATFAGSQIGIREAPTINSVFGETNSAGLMPGTLSTADLILLYNGAVYEKFYYFPGGFGQPAQWKNEAGAEAGSTAIPYGSGLVIQSRDAMSKRIRLLGNVKLGKTNIPVFEGYNLISNPNPVDGILTLSNSGLQDGLQGGTASTGDIVYIPKAGGGFDRYHYFPGGFGQPAGWRDASTGENADNVTLPNLGSFYILRRVGDTSITLAESTVSN